MIPFLFLFLLLAWPVGAADLPTSIDLTGGIRPCGENLPMHCDTSFSHVGRNSVYEPPVEFPFVRDTYANTRHNIEVSKDGKTWQPLPCLAQMEAAMRAMERFLPFEDAHGLVNVVPTTGLKEYKKSYDKFDAAKRDCWRSP